MEITDAPPTLPTLETTRTVRTLMLPMEEVERIREAGGPLAEVDLSQMHRALIAAVEVDGKIVAYWPVWRAVHAEPLWVAESHRRNPAVIRGILDQVEQAMDQMGDPLVFAVIGDQDILSSGHYAMRLGYERVPGDLFVLYRRSAPTKEGS